MTRPLGSFNRLVNMARHPEDKQRRPDEDVAKQPAAHLQYTLGLMRNKPGREETVPTNAEKFMSGRVRSGGGGSSTAMRMAGVELRNQLNPP